MLRRRSKISQGILQSRNPLRNGRLELTISAIQGFQNVDGFRRNEDVVGQKPTRLIIDIVNSDSDGCIEILAEDLKVDAFFRILA